MAPQDDLEFYSLHMAQRHLFSRHGSFVVNYIAVNSIAVNLHMAQRHLFSRHGSFVVNYIAVNSIAVNPLNALSTTAADLLRKHTYSNILKILQPKKEKIQIKNF